MSFLSPNDAEYISARITKKGRNAIAKGNFVISYFQIGDSEFDYSEPFSAYTGGLGVPSQRVLAPIDRESGIKYPYSLDVSGTTTFGVPVLNPHRYDTPVRNVMGPAGFINEYQSTGSTIQTSIQQVSISNLNGTNQLTVLTGNTYQNCNHITVTFNSFSNSVYSAKTNSLVYNIVSISGNTLTLDRKLPNLTGLTGNVEVICNSGKIEFPNAPTPNCIPMLPYPEEQHDPWKMEVVWTDVPIGYDVINANNTLSGLTSNTFVSTKSLLGYTSVTGQTFNNFTGGTISHPTSYLNSFSEVIDVPSNEQRTIAIIHYSELGDVVEDPERFYKYDDYISDETTTNDSIVDSRTGTPISDTEYFEVYIPFIQYHRNTGTTLGAVFHMDTTTYYLKSTINSLHSLEYRYLLDQQNNKVGKVFINNKIVVFDDQELVAILDYKSNRKYTLPAPKLNLVNSDTTASQSLLSGTTGQTIWVTYMLARTGDTTNPTQFNGLPCNYYSNISPGKILQADCSDITNPVPYNLSIKFSSDEFKNLTTTNVKTGYTADSFFVLAQKTTGTTLPRYDMWKLMDFTPKLTGHTSGQLIDRTSLVNISFPFTNVDYTSGTFFNLFNPFMESLPLTGVTYGTQSEYGDEQTFPGSVRLVRARDIEEFNFLVNLPSTQFATTQNPTYQSGERKMITEIALLDEKKEPLVLGKTSTPIQRIGTQVFAVKLDF
jgi:hypothetical protein